MSKHDWIRDLVRAEQQMEASDMVEFSFGFDAEHTLEQQTFKFLEELKENFVEFSIAFNQLKGVSVGNVRIYGIANTQSDFMLFRNGFKLVFALKKPGLIGIRFQHQGSFFPAPGPAVAPADGAGAVAAGAGEELVEAQWGAFGEINWLYQGHKVNKEYLVRYYLTSFIRESAK